MLGELTAEGMEESRFVYVAYAVYIAFAAFMSIVVFNLLISLVDEIYQEVKAKRLAYQIKERATVIAETEISRNIIRGFRDKCCPGCAALGMRRGRQARYLHVLLPVDDDNAGRRVGDYRQKKKA